MGGRRVTVCLHLYSVNSANIESPSNHNFIMKGTKVLTLGAGREVLPHNMAVTKM